MNDNQIDPFERQSAAIEQTIKTADIVERLDWQVRDEINERLGQDYTTHYVHGANMPSVRVALVNGALILMDGWHRLRAQQRLGREQIQAVVEELSESEAQWQAATANTRNGLRLRKGERRRVFEVYMQQGRNRRGRRGLKSYREIARDLGGIASSSSIANWMGESFPKTAARMSFGRTDNAGPDPRPRAISPARAAVQKALKQAVAEARGVRCFGQRLALAKELMKAAADIRDAQPWTPQPADDNDDF